MSQIREQVREYDTITVTPCTPHIGAEIGNIDLTRTAVQSPGRRGA